jgi:hypothetical protein
MDMSNGCCGWDNKNLGKDAIDFEYGKENVFYAQGYLPITEPIDEFISKITLEDEYDLLRDSGGVYGILGIIKGLEPKIYTNNSTRDNLRGLPSYETREFFESGIGYSIIKKGEKWRIELIGHDEYAVNLGAKRINNRLSAK